MPQDSNEYMTATDEEREIMREKRCMAIYMITDDVPCVCQHCGNVFVHLRNARRHVKTSKKCLALQNERAGRPNPPRQL